MTIQSVLDHCFGKYAELQQVTSDTYQLYAPFFHEDGDMYSIYIETHGNEAVIRDYGNALMRVSYTFDINTKNKQSILQNVVTGNLGELDDGELLMHTDIEHLQEAVFQYAQIIAKVSNIDILSRETIKSMFYEYLSDFISSKLSRFNVRKQVAPTSDGQLVVDYEIPGSKPFYLFGVNDNVKASRVVISCLNFQKKRLPFRSIVVHENFEGLTAFNRNQITNAADKQFTTLDDFREEGIPYFERELACAH
ncbi:MAG: DUF1828 domain-containing protein [Akkermansia sp.]